MDKKDILKLQNISVIDATFWSEVSLHEIPLAERIIHFLEVNSSLFLPSEMRLAANGRAQGFNLKRDAQKLLGYLQNPDVTKPVFLIQQSPFQALLIIQLDPSIKTIIHILSFKIDEEWLFEDKTSKSEVFLDFAKSLYNTVLPYFGQCHEGHDDLFLWNLKDRPIAGKFRGAYWATFVGADETRKIGKDILFAAPTYRVDALDDGGVCLLAGSDPITCRSSTSPEALQKLHAYLASHYPQQGKPPDKKLEIEEVDPTNLQEKAATLVRYFSDKGIQIGYSSEDVAKVENEVKGFTKEWELKDELGAYVGEVVRRLIGGEWGRLKGSREYVVIHPDGSMSNPFTKVDKYLTSKEGESLSWFIQGLILIKTHRQKA